MHRFSNGSHPWCNHLLLMLLTGAWLWPMAAATPAMGGEIVAIVGVSEQFGTREYLRIGPSNLELCRLDQGRLMLRRLLDKSDESSRQPLDELAVELGRLAQSGWPKTLDEKNSNHFTELPVDGPQWHFYLITREKDLMEVRDLSGYSRVCGLISFLPQIANQHGTPQPLVAGLLVDWIPAGGSHSKPARVWRTSDVPTIELLTVCGALVSDPLPPELRTALAGKQDDATIEASGQRFALQRVHP